MRGTVVRVHKGELHEVEVTLAGTTRRVLAKMAGRLAVRRVRCVAGDRVEVVLNEYDPGRGRITARLP